MSSTAGWGSDEGKFNVPSCCAFSITESILPEDGDPTKLISKANPMNATAR